MEIKLTRKQLFVLNLIQQGLANEILYGGAAGGGKSYLLRALAIIWAIQVPGVQIFLFRRKVKDLVATHMRGPTSFPMLLKEFVDDKLCTINLSNNYIHFENGSVISLNHCQHEADLNNFLSSEIHILLIDESTTFSEKMIRFLRGRLRIGSLPIPDLYQHCLPFIVYATNPRGESHLYFKSNFVVANEPGTPFLAPIQEGGMKRAFVQSLLKDNPHIEKEYADRLRGLGDPDIVEAYLSGDWSIVEGAALPSLSKKYHVIHHSYLCPSWPIRRGYDYGFSAPYFVIWYAVATGESSTKWHPPKGSIIFDACLYGANERDQGLFENVSVTAKKILDRDSLYYPYTSVLPGPADSAIFNKEQGPSIAEEFAEQGVYFTAADKSPGSRVLGLSEIRRLLYNAIFLRNEKPGLYFTDRASTVFRQLAGLQLDEKTVEDVNTKQNDHSYDVSRYIVLERTTQIQLTEVHGT